jgi:hypothetical protein
MISNVPSNPVLTFDADLILSIVQSGGIIASFLLSFFANRNFANFDVFDIRNQPCYTTITNSFGIVPFGGKQSRLVKQKFG